MAVVRYNPLTELRSMQEKMNRLLDMAWSRELGEELREGVWHPPVDIYEDDAAITVKMELPELTLDDLEIRFERGALTVKGERKHDPELRAESFHRVERYYGPFLRSFAFPMPLDGDRLEAECESGVLTIVLPKIKGA